MRIKKLSKNRLFAVIFGCFFALIGFFSVSSLTISDTYAIKENQTQTTQAENEAEESVQAETESETESESESESESTTTVSKDSCKNSLGALGWLVCPTTGKISEAVDWLYEKIEDILVINPVSSEDGSPIYEIWKYCLGITNIVFVIFLTIVIYSQITGVGISNYGIKKVLPKIIVVALLVNLSFLICSLAIDASNIIGSSLRQVFESVEAATMSDITDVNTISLSGIYSSLAGGTALAIGATTIAVETGAIWMLVPVALGALVAVVSGLITIALRQAVVILLVMISPLAFVASMLPNTENLFQKWKKTLTRMLVFYPTFSLLFGASNLAGWAIITSAQDSFTVMLGIAVQIFPLFFSWSLMKMSGTVLGTINDKMQRLAARPLMANRAWADSRRMMTKQKYLANNRAVTPSLRLMQYVSDRKVSREVETKEFAETVRNRGLVYNSKSHYKKDGTISKDGERAYEMQSRNIRYMQALDLDKQNFNMGLGVYNQRKDRNPTSRRSISRQARLDMLDNKMVEAADDYKATLERGAKIDYDNARSAHKRMSEAIDAHMDNVHNGDDNYAKHFNTKTNAGRAAYESGLKRYNSMLNIMDGDTEAVHYAAAGAAQTLGSQQQILNGKLKKYFYYTGPTEDVDKRLSELTSLKDPDLHMDSIVAGLSVLNERGDTDLVRNHILKMAANGVFEAGTYRTQAIANFLMFDVKGNDPNLRRFGKYLNMQTAAVFNNNESGKHRHNRTITFKEYLNGAYDDIGDDGIVKIRDTRGVNQLLQGTSFKDVERTAFDSMEGSMISACTEVDENGNEYTSIDKLLALEKKIDDSTFANLAGDHLGYLSGSEQIVAFAKYLTGKRKNAQTGEYEDNYDVFKNAHFRSEEERKEAERRLKEYRFQRTKDFYHAQVPNQVARAKTDLINPLQALFEDMAREKTPGQDDNYYKEQAGQILKDSLQPGVYDSLVKMVHKGYQGDSKSSLIQLLKLNDPKEIERVLGKNGTTNKKQQNNTTNVTRDEDEEEDGLPIIQAETNVGAGSSADYSEYVFKIEQIFKDYSDSATHSKENKREFYERACEVIRDIPQFNVQRSEIYNMSDNLDSFPAVSDIYTYFMEFLGGL